MVMVSVKLTSVLYSSTASTPPQMFQITAVSTTNLSFSWQEPANPNGAIVRYKLFCQPLRLGIPTPEPGSPGPTVRTTVLVNLLPGVRYNCSSAALNSAGRSDLVYADETTTEIGKDCICCCSLKFVFVHS